MGAWRLLSALALAPAVAVADCPDLPGAVATSTVGGYVARFRSEPPSPAVSEPFALEIAVCGPDSAYTGPLRVDADMPAHRHGMNYRPTLTTLGDGRYRADGMLLHMPGAWRFRFLLTTPDGPVRLAADHDQP